MRIYTIVVTFNGEKWIKKCIESIENSVNFNTNIENHILVVDNGSNDKTIQILKEFSNVQLIKTGANLGFGKANNIGIKMAFDGGADYVFLLNQDAYLFPDTISKLVVLHQQNLHFDLISPIHLNGAGKSLDILFSSFIEPKFCPDFYSDCYLNKLEDRIYEAHFVNAAAWLLTRNCIETIGGFSPVFYHYGEDNNYCDRMRYHGLKLGIYPFSRVCHDKEYRGNPFILSQNIQNTNELVKFSNPELGLEKIKEEIKIYQKSVLKFILKLNMNGTFYSMRKFKELKKLKKRIFNLVEVSKIKNPNFL
jgi:GT2 family glycosyltransferase